MVSDPSTHLPGLESRQSKKELSLTWSEEAAAESFKTVYSVRAL